MDADPNADMQGGAGVGGGRRMDEMDDLQRFKAMMKAREARGEQVLVAGGEKKEEEYVPGSDSAKSRTHSTEGIGANSTTPALQSNSSPLVGTGAPGLQRGVTKTPVPGNEPQLPLESILPSNSALKTDASQVATEKSSRFAKFFSGGREDQGVGMAPSPQPPLGRPVDSVGAAGVGGIVGGVPPPIEVRAFAGPGREPSPGFMTPQYAAKVPSDGAQTSVSPVQRHLPRQGSDFSQNLAASSEVLPGGVTVFPPQQPSQQSPAHLGMVPSVSAFPQPGRRPMSEQELLQVLGVRPPKPTPGPGMAYPNAPSQPPSADDFQRVMSMLANAKPSGQPPNVNMQMPPAGYPYAMVDRAPPQYVARGGMTPNAPTGPAPGIVRDERMAQGHGGIPRPPYNDGSNVASQFLTNLVQQGIAAGRGTAMGMGRSRYPADVGRGREGKYLATF
ncbi:hypothetical protein M427DRAFT_407656 [Gonapodya prolifera JEL478]|uniref:Uncharacterized protein n=1 Tax=Gonapodya prolifera (strain JEL478) TaxID=1344416 RepID=A0A139AUC6_GONPJ|nr:hypothetical protein M427DRAFT_407656 [Gonapodya prolifera JEL478]|eukprot:KXS20340.1 hypothetical protein M427DRAFT_407656 [Gonapodya prolifera JEL478]